MLEYSKEDQKIIDHFFTNTDSPVFAVKNFHPEVWALMQARYSRSNQGLRESFLKLLKEDSEAFEKLKAEIEKTGGGVETKHATEKAIQFMEKWVLGYGHSSVAEGAVIGLGLEDVSILATKVIESNRLCSFIEKSTRYVSFDKSSFYLDKDLMSSKYSDDIKKLFSCLIETYKYLEEPVLEHIKKIAPKEEGTTLPAWERACAARRFDSVRYVLPTATKTSLGWTVNARQLAHGISKLLSHQLTEMNEIGVLVKKEAGKVLPSLLRFADKKNYFVKTEKEMISILNSKNKQFADLSSQKCNPGVVLVNSPEKPEDTIIASMIFRFKKNSQPFKNILQEVKSMRTDEKEKVFGSYLKNMSDFDHPMRELEHEQFTFEVVMDYGAFRDLQRHRICTQTVPLLTANLGYDIPKDIIDAGAEIKKRYVDAMELAKKIYSNVSEEFPYQAQYLLPLGYRIRFLITMNLRELYHFIKLRTIPLAHESYRKIAYEFYEIMKKEHPMLSKYITCNYSQEELGRLKSEEKTEKLDKIGPL